MAGAATIEQFRQIALFKDLSDVDLGRICGEAWDFRLVPGDVLFHEGDPGDRAFVVTEGQLEIFKMTDRNETLIAVRGEGEVIGEMALLQSEPRSATVIARTPVHLISIPKAALDDLLRTSPDAARSIFTRLIQRIRETNVQLRHHERMAQLGVMTAGVAHELNNPSAALQRAASQLAEQVADLTELAGRGPFPGALELVAALEGRLQVARSGLESADAVEALEDWLEAHDVPDAWDVAPDLVDAGIGPEDLEGLTAGGSLADSVAFVARVVSARRAAGQMAEGSRRLSEIVGVLRSYAFLDRSPVQDVDVVQGIEDTLVLLGEFTDGIRVERQFADDLPTVPAMGAELNQVWTNLVRNACEAVADTPDPTVTLRAHLHDDSLVVEVEDNGPGVPPENQPRVFDAFFTTKPPGQGTGLGLQVSYRVVVLEHSGELTLESAPGRTVFKVVLPLHPQQLSPAQESRDSVAAPMCEHLADVPNTPKPEGGCPECLRSGDSWVHLRFCVTCGEIGCCNDSKNKHASRHAQAAGHPVMRSKEPHENFAWCFEHAIGIDLPPPE